MLNVARSRDNDNVGLILVISFIICVTNLIIVININYLSFLLGWISGTPEKGFNCNGTVVV